jgi:hypothetical protein
MNDFRSKILTGKKSKPAALLTSKNPRNKSASGENLEVVSVARSASRTSNHRSADRHRLTDEQLVSAKYRGKTHEVRLINLSGGGAMIEAPFRPALWDRIELELGAGGSSGRLECAVRWIKNERVGLEFAHETRIDADEDTSNRLLRTVIEQSFPEVAEEATVAEAAAEEPCIKAPGESLPADEDEGVEDQRRRIEPRHPLIWSGFVHYEHETTSVRLRNISATGALIEGGPAFKVGAELLLDLDEAGTPFATVSWVCGDQAGLEFRRRFDLARLAKSKPELAPSRWSKPDYLRDESAHSSPWASEWGRLSLTELQKTLGR